MKVYSDRPADKRPCRCKSSLYRVGHISLPCGTCLALRYCLRCRRAKAEGYDWALLRQIEGRESVPASR